MKQIQEHNPKEVAVSLDGWSTFRKGFIGVNLHYIHKWKRFKVNISCKHFTTSHTSENMWNFLDELFKEWGLTPRYT